MKEFESTKTLMEMLKTGQYKRPVMENNEEDAINFEEVFENYKAYTSRPDNYDYFTRRKTIGSE